MSVWEDFKLKYAPPKVEGLTVGFSGIDPAGYAATLTEEQLEIVKALVLAYMSTLTIRIDSGSIDPDAPPPEVQPITLKPSEIPHELLDGLMGGDEDGHYHLTDVQLDKLKAMIQTFVPDGEDVDPHEGISSHEMLNGLFGGNANGHYHFTSDEWGKLRKVLAVLFPDGATEPKFPSVTPSTDEPSEPEPEVELGGMPAADPPQWMKKETPIRTGDKKYLCHDGVNKMYFGPVYRGSSNMLLAPMRSDNTNSTNIIYWLVCSDTLLYHWASDVYCSYNLNTYGTSVGQFLTRTATSGDWYLYFLGYPSSDDIKYVRYDGSYHEGSVNHSSDVSTSWLAGCYSSTLKITLFVSKGGYSVYIEDGEKNSIASSATKAKARKGGIPLNDINPGCAVWIPTTQQFCVSGSQGVALSSDGLTWAGHTGSNIPKNLKDLTWKADISEPCLYAWREEDRKFYKSANALTWVVAGSLPSKSEISTITSVAYNSDLKEYCVIGGTSTYAYFSADLKTWRRTNIVAEGSAGIPMGSVIWCGDRIQKYMLMPLTGTSYYVFDRPNWK